MNFTEETLRNTNNERLFLHASHRPWSNDSPSYQSYPMSRLNGSAIASILLLSPSEMRHHRLPMPLKLYSILNNARQDVVSWLPDGRSFQIHHPERLERDILIHYFDCGDQSYLSFARLLSLWNFETGSANIYRHQFFVRGIPELLISMYLKDADKGLHEAKGKFCSYNSPPFLPMHDDDLTSDVSPLMGNFQSKPFLQPRLAFNGLAFTANSPSLCLPSSTTSIFTGIPHLASSAELSAREGRVVLTSPTSILAPLTDESSSSSPLTKRRRYLPQLEPVSAGDQPLFVAPRVLYATNGSSPILNSFSR